MKIKFLRDEDITNYKKMSMFIGTIQCTWKCCKEASLPCSICQNYPWSNNPVVNMQDEEIVERYLNNFLTEAIVIGGLEPFDQFDEIYSFIEKLRNKSNDDVVIYTGYKREEIEEKVDKLKNFINIIIKYGRYIPNTSSIKDELLGVTLASNNQYAIKES